MAAGSSSASAAASPPTRPVSCCGCSPSRATGSGSCPPPPRCGSSARRPGRRCPASRSPTTSGPTCTRCRTCGSARRPTSSSSRRPPPTCWPRPPTASPTTCSPTRCSPRAARSCSRRRCTPRCGSTRPPWPTSPRCAPAACWSSSRRSAGSPAPTPARAGCPTRRRSSPSPAGSWPGGGAAADLAGRHVVVTAGGTREPLDPVRFLGNRSSGKQGYAFARTAVARGARVTLIAANVALPDPAGVDLVRVGTTEELRKATLEAAAGRRRGGDGRGARPTSGRPTYAAAEDQEDGRTAPPPPIELVTNPDIAAELGAAQAGRPGAGRVRRRDRATRWPTPGRSWPARGPT